LRQSQTYYKRIVIKIGSSLFCSGSGNCDFTFLSAVARDIILLSQSGHEVIIVSSGAIALGMHALGMKERPKKTDQLQAAAAVGQNEVINQYRQFFQKKGLHPAQVLLTWEDFDSRKRYLNARNTLITLLGLKCIPIVNENDTISTDEIKFGDNDRLSALVATLVDADLLVILSDVDGLLDGSMKNLVKVVNEINPQIKAMACSTTRKTCVGGMITKIEAAAMSTDSGITCVIANGRKPGIIRNIVKDPLSGGNWTVILPKSGSLAARQRWIAFGTKPKGSVIVDAGAKAALINKKSLLSVGVIACRGSFNAGDVVCVIDQSNHEFARGKVGVTIKELDKVKGKRHDKEVIHRDNIVIL
jgi:glutamate 5-kinase